jgi:hypothetical protein
MQGGGARITAELACMYENNLTFPSRTCAVGKRALLPTALTLTEEYLYLHMSIYGGYYGDSEGIPVRQQPGCPPPKEFRVTSMRLRSSGVGMRSSCVRSLAISLVLLRSSRHSQKMFLTSETTGSLRSERICDHPSLYVGHQHLHLHPPTASRRCFAALSWPPSRRGRHLDHHLRRIALWR